MIFFAVKTRRMADKEDSQKSEGNSKNLMTKEDVARIQSAEAKQHGGGVEKGGFTSRAQRAAEKNEAAEKSKDNPENKTET